MKTANYLFTSSSCAGCVPVKKMIEQKELPINIVSIDTPDGAKLAGQFFVRSLPTLVLDNGEKTFVGTGTCISGLVDNF